MNTLCRLFWDLIGNGVARATQSKFNKEWLFVEQICVNRIKSL